MLNNVTSSNVVIQMILQLLAVIKHVLLIVGLKMESLKNIFFHRIKINAALWLPPCIFFFFKVIVSHSYVSFKVETTEISQHFWSWKCGLE